MRSTGLWFVFMAHGSAQPELSVFTCIRPTLEFLLSAQSRSNFACLRGLSFNHNTNQKFWCVKSVISISIWANILHTSDLFTSGQQCSVFITIARLWRPSHLTRDLWGQVILSVSPSSLLISSVQNWIITPETWLHSTYHDVDTDQVMAIRPL